MPAATTPNIGRRNGARQRTRVGPSLEDVQSRRLLPRTVHGRGQVSLEPSEPSRFVRGPSAPGVVKEGRLLVQVRCGPRYGVFVSAPLALHRLQPPPPVCLRLMETSTRSSLKAAMRPN